MIPALIGAAGAIGGALLSNHLNRRNADYAFDKQKAYNNWLLGNQTQKQVQDLRSAGINPAFMNGSQLGNTPSPPSYDTPTMQSPIDLSSAMMFGQVGAQTDNLNASALFIREQAEAQRIENERSRQEDIESARLINENEKSVSVGDLDEWVKNHPNEVPETILIPSKGAKGILSARRRFKEYERQIQDVSINDVRNHLETMVTNGQITNPDVIQALVQMPYREFDNLVNVTKKVVEETKNVTKQGELLDIEKVSAELEMQIRQDSNIFQYIDKFWPGDSVLKDICKASVLIFMGIFGKLNFAPIGTRKTSSSNTNSSNVNSTSHSTVNSKSRSTVHVYPHAP